MKTVAFKATNSNNLKIILEVIKQFGYKPEIIEDSDKSPSKLSKIASKTKKRILSQSQIDKMIADERKK